MTEEKNRHVKTLIEQFGLTPHPEGGHYRETYRSEGTIPAGDIITVKYVNSKDIPPADDSDTDTKTGDDTSLAIPAAVMAASLAAIAAVLAGIRRKSRK